MECSKDCNNLQAERKQETTEILKQGTVLGPSLCSSSTGEYCDVNTGICVGDLVIAALLYVGDIIDLSNTKDECETAHGNTKLFAKQKKLFFSAEPSVFCCACMRKGRKGR